MSLILLACIFGTQSVPDGTLLFVENGCNPIERYTGSSYTHVAIFVSGQIYEAKPPKVRRVDLDRWLMELARFNEGNASPALVTMMIPTKEFASQEIEKVISYLRTKVGCPYTLSGYLKNRPVSGIHCSQLCSEALAASGRFRVASSLHVSPNGLRLSVWPAYDTTAKIYVRVKPEYRRTCCQRVRDWWKALGRRFEWSCWELLQFAR